MITFKIRNPNSRSITSIEVYRELTGVPIPDVPVNPPLQKLDGFTTAIIDYDVVTGNTYDYRIRTVREGGDFAMSPVFTFKAVSPYGPGGFLEPMAQTVGAALLDKVTSLEELPSLQELLALFDGQPNNAINWTDKWVKVKQGSDIYFFPSMGYIEVPKTNIATLLSRINATPTITKGDCKYSFRASDLQERSYMPVLDGRFVCKYPLPTEYPRKSMASAINDIVGKNIDNVRVFMTVSESTSTVKAYKDTRKYGSSVASIVNPVSDSGTDWYWKPILKFVQESGVV
ncbi:virion structural protein [Pseudomonas phage Churi]|nr:virion structural protein [Pseudomonas phage Churi01]